MKLPAHRPGLPGKVISFYIVPLDPTYMAGLAGHVPVKAQMTNLKIVWHLDFVIHLTFEICHFALVI